MRRVKEAEVFWAIGASSVPPGGRLIPGAGATWSLQHVAGQEQALVDSGVSLARVDGSRLLVGEMGYEVWETPDEVLFCDRRISMLWFWRLFLGAWTLALLLLAPVVGLVLALQGEAVGYVVIAIAIGLGVATGLATRVIHRAFERRRDAPLSDVPRLAVIDRATKSLRVGGETIAACADAKARITLARGDSSRGIMRWVVVRVGRRSLRLFKTNSLDTAKQVRDVLGAYGVGTSS